MYWVSGRDATSGEPARMLSDATTPAEARAQAAAEGLVPEAIEPIAGPPPEPRAGGDPPGRLRVRLWVVSLALFAGGFAGRLVLDARGAAGATDPAAVPFQAYAYGAGLAVWAAWWALQAPPGRGGAVGCLAGVALAVAAAAALLSSVPK